MDISLINNRKNSNNVDTHINQFIMYSVRDDRMRSVVITSNDNFRFNLLSIASIRHGRSSSMICTIKITTINKMTPIM